MSIQRAPRPEHGYTLILDQVLRDSRLSYRARGVLAAVLSRPDNWTTTAEQLASEGTEGRDAIRTALKELDEAGYIERRKEQVERGRWTTQTIVYDRPRTAIENPSAKASSPTTENPSPVAGKPSPETDNQPSVDQPSVSQALRRTTEKNNQLQEPSSSETADAASDNNSANQIATAAEAADEPFRDDVERLCQHLADRIEGNGSKRPTITKAWRRECRLMLDRDHREEHQVRTAIDWCQDDSFWKSNILSMPKLREQYDRLRLIAFERAQAQVRGQSNQRQQRTNQVFDAAMDRARARDAATATPQPQGALTR